MYIAKNDAKDVMGLCKLYAVKEAGSEASIRTM